MQIQSLHSVFLTVMGYFWKCALSNQALPNYCHFLPAPRSEQQIGMALPIKHPSEQHGVFPWGVCWKPTGLPVAGSVDPQAGVDVVFIGGEACPPQLSTVQPSDSTASTYIVGPPSPGHLEPNPHGDPTPKMLTPVTNTPRAPKIGAGSSCR